MAIALDASSPALVSEQVDGTVSTATFSPPAQSLLAAMVFALDDETGPVVSGGGLTWTRRIHRTDGLYNEDVWTAPAPLGGSGIAITVTAAGFGGAQFTTVLKTDVYTGCDLTTPVGATGQGASTTNNAVVDGYTATVIGSRGVAAAVDVANLGMPSSTYDASAFDLAGLDGLMVRKAANTASLATVTFNLDAAGSGTPNWQWVAAEILPAAEVAGGGRGRMIGQAVTRTAYY